MAKSTAGKRGTRRARTSGRAQRPSSQRWTDQLHGEQIGWVVGLLLLGIALITFLSLLSREHGAITGVWLGILRRAFGWGAYVIPLGLALLGAWTISLGTKSPLLLPRSRLLGLLCVFLGGLALSHHFQDAPLEAILTGRGGGQLGYWVSRGLTSALGWLGATVMLVTLVAMGVTLAIDVPLDEVMADLVARLRAMAAWVGARVQEIRMRRQERRVEQRMLPLMPRGQLADPARSNENGPPSYGKGLPRSAMGDASTISGTPISSQISRNGSPDRNGPGWALPSIGETLVESDETRLSISDIREKTHIIEETLYSLGVPVTVVEVNPGPVVTQFGLEPGYLERRDRQGNTKRVKVKVSRISALANDLSLALAASPIRIEAPVPGKGVVGLEVPNRESAIVGLRSVIESDEFRDVARDGTPDAIRLAIALGRDVSGAAIADDLASLPHLLIAGATGSGKSVCINTLIATLLFRNTPDDLRLLMVDPKRVELSAYDGIPHLLAPVVVEMERVVGVLNWVTHEMERRYKVFARAGSRNIQSYNQLASARGEMALPYIVVFIDELADLMMISPDEVERLICRIAQMARATGIHLVIATQRPSVDVITGLIKANIPARVSFAVSSQTDSRVILDVPGAEKLLGRGDALYMAPDSPKLARVQGCFVSDAELGRLVSFWRTQTQGHLGSAGSSATGATASMGSPLGAALDPSRIIQQPLWPGVEDAEEKGAPHSPSEDPLLDQAIDLVTAEGRASVSFLQRRLRVGYTRAARLVDILEDKGVIGPATGSSRARKVYAQRESDSSEGASSRAHQST